MATMKATVFLGGGRITGALAAGLRLAGDRRRIVVYDRHPEKVRALRRECRVETARDLRSAISDAEMLVIAVRPGSVKEMLAEVVACGTRVPRLCVSLAAGVPLRNLRAWLGSPVRWVRAMPSPVCRIGRGLTPVCFDRSVAKSERMRVRAMFAQVGPVLDLPESQFDAITASHSPTHGYHAVATLARAAQGAGLSRETALIAAAHALSDGIQYWRQSGSRLEELLLEAATPGGIAAATMAAMDEAGYARVVAKGLAAGIGQARRNAKG
ncbi:MAG TPA: NAD(P)-binding domain-containing protein [Candidatus Dormibacteraeota bacterium]|nr:NAD(P)-binding domain-containing protein [Candidatus Dormibacteraeota bacterium]